MSDIGALTLIAAGVQSLAYPDFTFPDPIKPYFDVAATAETAALSKMMGGIFLILGCMLFTVRWNTVNGKLSGMACIGAAYNIFNVVFNTMDKAIFVLRPFYIIAGVLALTGLHLMFNANAMIKPADAKKKA